MKWGMIFVLLAAVTAVVGCRHGAYGSWDAGGGGGLATGNGSISGTITYAMLNPGSNIRTYNPGDPIQGASVWVEGRYDQAVTTDKDGKYRITGLPAGTYRLVAQFIEGNKTYKMRSEATPVEENVNKEVVLGVAESKNIVRGKIIDENGKPLPKNTVLYLWGEPFRILDDSGTFETPPLPDLDVKDILQEIIVFFGLPNEFRFPASFLSSETPLEVEFTVPSTPEVAEQLPVVALTAIQNGEAVREVAAESEVTIRAVVSPPDVSAANLAWSADKGDLGEATTVNGNLREKTWTAPKEGPAVITLVLTSGGKTAKVRLTINITGGQNPDTFSVTYDGNQNTGGSAPVDGTSYTTGQQATVLDNTGNLVKTGYTFDGWNTRPDGQGTTYAAGDELTVNTNVTLYAKWKESTFTITYYGNGNDGGTVPIDKNTYRSGDEATILGNTGNLSKNGYIFVGWTTLPFDDPDAPVYNNGHKLTIPPFNVKMYAKWLRQQFLRIK